MLVGDKYTDDDIAYLMYRDDPTGTPRYCERVRECACLNHKACTELTVLDSNGDLVAERPDMAITALPAGPVHPSQIPSR